MLLNVCKFEIKINSKHLTSWRMAPKHPKSHSLSTKRCIYYKRFTLEEKNKNLEDFVKVFYKTTICPRNHFWVVSRLVVLYRFDCRNTPDITVPVTSEAVGPVPSSDLCELANWIIVRYLIYITLKVNLFYFSRNHWWPIDIRRVS